MQFVRYDLSVTQGGGPEGCGIFAVSSSHMTSMPNLRQLESIPLGPAFAHLQPTELSTRQEADGSQIPLLEQGDADETLQKILTVVEDMKTEWPADKYDLLRRNCK